MSVELSYNRREFLRLTATAAGVACAPFGGCYSKTIKPAGDTSKRPNIIYIIADDLGWADIGYHGSEIKTPNLDGLAHKGMRFNQHYVMATCTPTRVGLLSGRYPSRFGVTSPAYGKIFDDDTVTLAAALHNSGYDTAITGKWHMGSPPEHTPLKYGFNSSYGYFHGQIDPYTHHYKTGSRAWHRNDEYLNEEGHATDLITDEAVRIVESEHQNRFSFMSLTAYRIIRWTNRKSGPRCIKRSSLPPAAGMPPALLTWTTESAELLRQFTVQALTKTP